GARQRPLQDLFFLVGAFLPRCLTSLSFATTTPASTSALYWASVSSMTGSDEVPIPCHVPPTLSSTRRAWIYCSLLRIWTACPIFISFQGAGPPGVGYRLNRCYCTPHARGPSRSVARPEPSTVHSEPAGRKHAELWGTAGWVVDLKSSTDMLRNDLPSQYMVR